MTNDPDDNPPSPSYDDPVFFTPGCTVLYQEVAWVVRRVNVGADGKVYSLNIDRPGVTTCVGPSHVIRVE
jgi:hypothetical protein